MVRHSRRRALDWWFRLRTVRARRRAWEAQDLLEAERFIAAMREVAR